jgi:hypothetical protein
MTIGADANGDARLVFEPSDAASFLSLVSQTSAFADAGSVTLVGVRPEDLRGSDFVFA